MNQTLQILVVILCLVNAGVCIMLDNWTGLCGWTVAVISNIDTLLDLLEK